MLGFFGLYMASVLLLLGFSLDEILEKVHNTLNPLELVNGGMLYIVLLGLSFRFFMQQLNTFNLPPYQVLPVKRSSLINFLLLKSLLSPINYFFLLVIIPFTVQSVVKYYDATVGIRFVLSFVFIVWFNSLMAAFLKRKFGPGFLSFIIVVLILVGIAALEYFRIFSIFDISKSFFNFIIFRPFGLIIPLLMAFTALMLNKWFFSQNYYPENFNRKMKSDDKTVATDLSFLNRFGVIGELISLELKLILRHKRTKSILYMSGFFLFYGLIFYTKDIYANNNGLLFFVAMFMTGLLMLMYGQWSISWDSGHFDSLMTRNIPVRTYLNANYYLMIAFNVICFVLTTPYFLFGEKIMFMHIAAFIFNVGVNVYLLLFLATFNTKRVDLSKSSAMNYQGTTYKSFLIVLPIMFVPMILVWVLSSLTSISVALWTLTALGLAGILFRNQMITLCVSQFNRRKYKLAEGFREGE